MLFILFSELGVVGDFLRFGSVLFSKVPLNCGFVRYNVSRSFLCLVIAACCGGVSYGL